MSLAQLWCLRLNVRSQFGRRSLRERKFASLDVGSCRLVQFVENDFCSPPTRAWIVEPHVCVLPGLSFGHSSVVELFSFVKACSAPRGVQKFSPRLCRFVAVILLLALLGFSYVDLQGLDRLHFSDVQECRTELQDSPVLVVRIVLDSYSWCAPAVHPVLAVLGAPPLL